YPQYQHGKQSQPHRQLPDRHPEQRTDQWRGQREDRRPGGHLAYVRRRVCLWSGPQAKQQDHCHQLDHARGDPEQTRIRCSGGNKPTTLLWLRPGNHQRRRATLRAAALGLLYKQPGTGSGAGEFCSRRNRSVLVHPGDHKRRSESAQEYPGYVFLREQLRTAPGGLAQQNPRSVEWCHHGTVVTQNVVLRTTRMKRIRLILCLLVFISGCTFLEPVIDFFVAIAVFCKAATSKTRFRKLHLSQTPGNPREKSITGSSR